MINQASWHNVALFATIHTIHFVRYSLFRFSRHPALSDLKSGWLEVLLKHWIFNSALFIEDLRKIRRFVFKITNVKMHAKQALLTLLNRRRNFPFGLKSSLHFFLFSFLLVVNKIIHFLMARRRSNSQRRRLIGPAAGPFWEGWDILSTNDWPQEKQWIWIPPRPSMFPEAKQKGTLSRVGSKISGVGICWCFS